MNLTSPISAASAYRTAARMTGTESSASEQFGSMVSNAMRGLTEPMQRAETESLKAVSGKGDPADLVTALANAELMLQTTITIRDRAMQSFTEIMRMPI